MYSQAPKAFSCFTYSALVAWAQAKPGLRGGLEDKTQSCHTSPSTSAGAFEFASVEDSKLMFFKLLGHLDLKKKKPRKKSQIEKGPMENIHHSSCCF